MVITAATLPYLLGYVAIGFACRLWVDRRPGGRIALRYLVGDVIVYAGFVGLLWVIGGVFHPVLVLLVAGVFAFNAFFVRFCSVCGVISRGGMGPCKRCRQENFLGLREALSRELPTSIA